MLNHSGKTFGRLTVLNYAGRNKYNFPLWKCHCSCGNITIVVGSSLSSNLTKSCGCLKREVIGSLRRSHGMSGTREHLAWQDMRRRCSQVDRPEWIHYGGRGITICKRWGNFANFLKDMGKCPPGYTLERKNNDGPYSKRNCIWASRKTQSRNTRRNIKITYQGVTRIMVEWAEIMGLDYGCLKYRIKHGWSVEKALMTPSAAHPSGHPAPAPLACPPV